MLNTSQIPNKLYLAERFVQTSGHSMNQGIGTSVLEYWRRRGGGGGWAHDVSYQKRGGGTFEWGVEIFKGG